MSVFVSSELAATIDRAEGRLCSAIAAGVASRGAAVLDDPIGGGRAVMARPGAPVNKLIGAGFELPIDQPALARIEESWGVRGEPVRVELATLALPETATRLTARGYRLHGFENVLGRNVSTVPIPDGVAVEPAEDPPEWMSVVVDGFASPDIVATAEAIPREAVERVIEDFVHAPGFLRYVARVDGRVAGGASLRIDGDLAFLCGAATAPAFRRRGVQSALLAARMNDAHAAGATLAVVTTAPGSPSQRNVMRRGFALMYARAILIQGTPPAS